MWSGPRDEWLANILLTSARASIKDQPGKELTGYVLETLAGTFPALAISGRISEEELHSLVGGGCHGNGPWALCFYSAFGFVGFVGSYGLFDSPRIAAR